MNEDWHLENHILATVEFDSNLKKTGENLHDQITSVLTTYGISPDKIVFFSDQGLNIKVALRNYHQIPCSVHNLNTVLKHTFREKNQPEGIWDVVKVIDHFKSLVAYLKRSSAVASLKHCDSRMWGSMAQQSQHAGICTKTILWHQTAAGRQTSYIGWMASSKTSAYTWLNASLSAN